MCTSRGNGGGGGGSPLKAGNPETINTYYSRGVAGISGSYNAEALDATFDSSTGILTLDYAADKEWEDSGSRYNKRQYVDITVRNGIINGRPVNVDFANNNIKSVDAPLHLTEGTEKMLRNNDFEYSSKSKKWEKGYKGYYAEGNVLHVDKSLPNDISQYKSIKGNTYDLRGSIKKAGFKWNGANKSWDK